jgi:hypothetical protein
MKKIAFVLGIILLSASRFADVQEIKITGTVISGDDNNPLPGVNIVEKGTVNGVITDIEGKYEINVSGEKAVLTFSAVGFVTEEITIGSRSVLDVAMQPDVTSLEEIVVMGYSSQRKSGITGSVSVISGTRAERKRGKSSQSPQADMIYASTN